MTANGRHLALSGRRGTPADWVEMSRVALGGRIELDPMSEPVFNQVVRADRYFTEEDDALEKCWNATTLFLNPHGGLVVEAWRKLNEERRNHFISAIWIGFSMEQLNLLADEVDHPMDFSMLVVRSRIDFLTTDPMRTVMSEIPNGILVLECGHRFTVTARKHAAAKQVRCSECEGSPEPLGSPTHSNYVVGLGIPADRFEAAFAGRGRFSHGQFAIAREGLRLVAEDEQFGGVA